MKTRKFERSLFLLLRRQWLYMGFISLCNKNINTKKKKRAYNALLCMRRGNYNKAKSWFNSIKH